MKAVLSKTVGGPETLVIEDVPVPAPGKNQVLIQVKACGVNYPDVLIIQDMYQFKPPRPFSPGGEVSGIVSAVGEGVSHVKAGDRVLASTGNGGMAEYCLAAAHGVMPIPDGMPFDEAAAFLMTYGTSYYALKDRADPKPGEKLLVLGAAGGVGIAAVELGKAMGLEVIAAASSQEKVDFCLGKGADKGLVYPRELDKDAQKKFAEDIKAVSGGGVDIVYDGVGGNYAEPAVRAMNWEGRFLVIGFPAGIPETAAEPDAPEKLRCARRVLGRGGGARSEGACAELQGTLRPLQGRQDPPARLQFLPARQGAGRHPRTAGPQGAGQGGCGDVRWRARQPSP